MAQTQCMTTEGLTELGVLIAGTGGSKITSMICLKTECTAEAGSTYANETKATESGLTVADCDSVAASTNVVTAYHTFTAGEAATLKGFLTSSDENDCAIGICCYNADVVMETSDTLKNTMTFTLSNV